MVWCFKADLAVVLVGVLCSSVCFSPKRFDVRVGSCSGGGGGFVSRSLLSGDGVGALFLISYLPFWLTDGGGGALSQRFPAAVLIQGFLATFIAQVVLVVTVCLVWVVVPGHNSRKRILIVKTFPMSPFPRVFSDRHATRSQM
ncbi:hypothetical protein A2U01_0036882 [Trifolium medium]|uniref:Uncharacterized protein n=1 Tax=Trifolium medium TaxID=97028 RepID=A0A392PV91_9FABA|nr:hypothetical protein [Trifolium medium]